MPVHKKTIDIGSGSLAMTQAITLEPSAEANTAIPVVDGTVDKEVAVFVNESNLVSFHIISNQVVTVDTNSSSTPQETFSLDGVAPESWMLGDGAKPIAGDVTSLFISNSSGADAIVKLIAGWETKVSTGTSTATVGAATAAASGTLP